MKILVTGAGGFLGRGMIEPLAAAGHQLRLMDVRSFDSAHEVVVGDVGQLDDLRRAMAGMDALIITHMAPRSPDSYAEPPVCFAINVTGTANCFFAAVEAGIQRVVLISSVGALSGQPRPLRHDMPPLARGLYGLTKSLQERIAEQYHREHGLRVAVLRPSHIMCEDNLKDKYDERLVRYKTGLGDPRDIGEVARLCLERDDIAWECFQVMGTPESMSEWDVAYTCERLGWQPRYTFAAAREQASS